MRRSLQKLFDVSKDPGPVLQTDFDEIFGAVGRGPRTSPLHFGGYSDQDPDPVSLNPDQDLYLR